MSPAGRLGLLLVALVVAVLAIAEPAGAQADQTGQDDGTQVVLTGRAEVRAGERADTVVILDGPATIDGLVDGAVVALNGDIRVTATGVVEEAVVALNGRAFIEDGARVGGDVVSSRSPQVGPGATVEGETRTVRFSFRALGVLFWIAWWFAVTFSVLVLGLLLLRLAPRAMAAALAVAQAEVGPAIAWGVAIGIGLPVLSVLVMLTLIGIPLGLLGLLSLGLIFTLGYVVGALAVGRLMVKEPTSRYLAFLAGLVVLRLAGLVPFIGGLVTFVAFVYGVGALAIAAGRAARREPEPAVVEPVAG
jgi:cytoskeletal protein CcmA (bactofilin family)